MKIQTNKKPQKAKNAQAKQKPYNKQTNKDKQNHELCFI